MTKRGVTEETRIYEKKSFLVNENCTFMDGWMGG